MKNFSIMHQCLSSIQKLPSYSLSRSIEIFYLLNFTHWTWNMIFGKTWRSGTRNQLKVLRTRVIEKSDNCQWALATVALARTRSSATPSSRFIQIHSDSKIQLGYSLEINVIDQVGHQSIHILLHLFVILLTYSPIYRTRTRSIIRLMGQNFGCHH